MTSLFLKAPNVASWKPTLLEPGRPAFQLHSGCRISGAHPQVATGNTVSGICTGHKSGNHYSQPPPPVLVFSPSINSNKDLGLTCFPFPVHGASNSLGVITDTSKTHC